MFNKKVPVLSFVLYVLSGILAIYTIWSISFIYSYIAGQQVPFSGNEYTVVNYYMANAGQYLVYAITFFTLGWILQKFSPKTTKATAEVEELSTFNYETVPQETEETVETDHVEEYTVDETDDLVK